MRILLLTPGDEAEAAMAALRAGHPDLAVVPVQTHQELDAATRRPAPDDRLVAFCTSVIVGRDILERLPGPAYNFHPGPPEYPGLYPAVFAIHDGARRFGATAHEMAPEVDRGTIVGVERHDIDAHMDRLNLEALSRILVTRLFQRLAPLLAGDPRPLPALDIPWGPRITRRADFDALCEIPAGISADDFARRYRAVGEGPHHGLRVLLHGRWFRIENLAGDGHVYKGGRATIKADA